MIISLSNFKMFFFKYTFQSMKNSDFSDDMYCRYNEYTRMGWFDTYYRWKKIILNDRFTVLIQRMLMR